MNSTFKPKVSIITPVYNGARFLDALILSVQEQDYPDIEHIIIDDGSSDGGATIEVLNQYPHLRWWTRPNKGQYPTMNEGLLTAKGEIVIFLSADDILLPGSVSKVITFLDTHQGVDGVYGNFGYINFEGKPLKMFQPMSLMPTRLYPYSLHISHSSFYIRKNALIINDLFFIGNLKYVGDYSWITRILKANLKIRRIKDSLSMIRIHGMQASKTKFLEMRKETILIQKKLGVSLILASFFRKLWFGINLINAAKIGGIKGINAILYDRFGKKLHP